VAAGQKQTTPEPATVPDNAPEPATVPDNATGNEEAVRIYQEVTGNKTPLPAQDHARILHVDDLVLWEATCSEWVSDTWESGKPKTPWNPKNVKGLHERYQTYQREGKIPQVAEPMTTTNGETPPSKQDDTLLKDTSKIICEHKLLLANPSESERRHILAELADIAPSLDEIRETIAYVTQTTKKQKYFLVDLPNDLRLYRKKRANKQRNERMEIFSDRNVDEVVRTYYRDRYWETSTNEQRDTILSIVEHYRETGELPSDVEEVIKQKQQEREEELERMRQNRDQIIQKIEERGKNKKRLDRNWKPGSWYNRR
jgi:hypothetical protein